MSADAVSLAARLAAFRPSTKPWLLSEHHVPLDELIGVASYESLAARRLTESPPEAVAVLGPSGAGKSSLISWVSASLSRGFVAIRLPVSAVDDPTDTGEVLKLSLGTVLEAIDLDSREQQDVRAERANAVTRERSPTGISGGKIGGGPIPIEVNFDVGSLRTEFSEGKLDGDYLPAVNRVIAVLADKKITPIFVLEDTEAIVGGDKEHEVARGFFEGPLKAFVEKIDAACLVAAQTHLTAAEPSFQRLAASMEIIEIPHLKDEAREGLGGFGETFGETAKGGAPYDSARWRRQALDGRRRRASSVGRQRVSRS